MAGHAQQILTRFDSFLETPVPVGDDRFAGWLQEWTALYGDVHQLAEEQELALPPLLRPALGHPAWNLRSDTLTLVGFHDDLSGDASLLEHIRVMLLSDPGGNGIVRSTAASILGVQSYAWDESLVSALTDDPAEDVRRVAFHSLLHLLELGPGNKRRLLAEVEAGGRTPTLATLREFAARYDP